jgi:hypothetical protein
VKVGNDLQKGTAISKSRLRWREGGATVSHVMRLKSVSPFDSSKWVRHPQTSRGGDPPAPVSLTRSRFGNRGSFLGLPFVSSPIAWGSALYATFCSKKYLQVQTEFKESATPLLRVTNSRSQLGRPSYHASIAHFQNRKHSA